MHQGVDGSLGINEADSIFPIAWIQLRESVPDVRPCVMCIWYDAAVSEGKLFFESCWGPGVEIVGIEGVVVVVDGTIGVGQILGRSKDGIMMDKK